MGKPGCTGYSTTDTDFCVIYGFINSAEITSTASSNRWKPEKTSYFVPSKTITMDPQGKANCYRRTKVADLIEGTLNFLLFFPYIVNHLMLAYYRHDQ